jgi:hypothetical protein
MIISTRLYHPDVKTNFMPIFHSIQADWGEDIQACYSQRIRQVETTGRNVLTNCLLQIANEVFGIFHANTQADQ